MKNIYTWELHPVNSFHRFSEQWDTLNKLHSKSPLLEHRFIGNVINAFSDGKERLCVCYVNDVIVAMGIFCKTKFGTWQTFQPSQAPLGAWVQHDNLDLDAALYHLWKKLPGIVFVVGITQQDPDINHKPEETKHITTIPYIETARIPLTDTFDSYWKERGKNLRQNMRRQNNKLNRDNISVRTECINNPDNVASAISDYGNLESAGWKAQGGTAIHKDNDQGKFYIKLLTDYCQTGVGRIYKCYYNDKLVAVDLCITGFGKIIILKTTYDETIKATSPANIMRLSYMPELFDNPDIENIEFYGKVMEWHRKWSSDIREMYHINYKNFSLF